MSDAPEVENIDDGVRLTLHRVEVDHQQLTLVYAIDNGSPSTIYLVNQLFHRLGRAGFQVDPNLAYAMVDAECTLYIRKQMINVPDDMDVEAPEVPYVTVLPSGESFSETVRLSLPVMPHDPYRPQEEADAPYEAPRLSFVLGYVSAEHAFEVHTVTMPDGSTRFRIDYADVRRWQRLKVAGPVEIAVPVAIVAPARR